MDPQKITPEYVNSFDKATDKFLCPLSANIYNIQFLAFKIRDMESKVTLFEIKKEVEEELTHTPTDVDENELRTVRYHFGPLFFKLKTIGTALVFSVGDKPVKNMRMIERHYFKNKLIKSFDFTFGFCIPNSTNEWESIYDLPQLDKKTIEEMINAPWETKSDSFYFVNNELVMHNKSEYSYAPFEDETD